MKKIFLCAVVLLSTLAFVGCGNRSANNGGEPADKTAANEKVKIVTTIFPLYDWVKQIAGDNAERLDLTMLMAKGVDLHSYQPTPEDMLKVSRADMIVYVGGESDAWIDDAVKEAANKNMIKVKLMDVMGNHIKWVEEDEDEHDEHHNHHQEHGHKHSHDTPEPDEHIWLSLKNAQILCNAITDALTLADPNHADTYRRNGHDYQAKLAALDEKYAQTVAAAGHKTLIFGDRFPFRYLVDDYGIHYYSAFNGCSSESEASFKTIAFLAHKVDETNANAILALNGSDGKIAAAIRDNTTDKRAKILTLDSMQSTTLQEAQQGSTYLSAMEENLTVIKEALQ